MVNRNTPTRRVAKVQLSLASPDNVRRVLVYTKRKDILWHGTADNRIIDKLRGALRSFWWIYVEAGGAIVLEAETTKKDFEADPEVK